MLRRLLRTVGSLLLLAALLSPVLECFDHWDQTAGLAGDSEFEVAAAAAVTGLAVITAAAVFAARILLGQAAETVPAPLLCFIRMAQPPCLPFDPSPPPEILLPLQI